MQRTSLGAAWGGGGMSGTGYLGFNLYRDNVNTGRWPFMTDGASNGGSVIFGRSNGDIVFSTKTNTGRFIGSLSDVDIINNIKLSIAGSGKVDILSGDLTVRNNQAQRVSLGAAWGGGGMFGFGYIGFNLMRDNISTGRWPFVTDGANNGGAVIYTRCNGDLLFSIKASTGSASGSISDEEMVNNTKMLINSEGKVIIGNPVAGISPSINFTSNNYRLFVEKGILTERVRVAIKGSAEWADFVFSKDYRLMPLNELSTYISNKHHLPGIPGVDEVLHNGIDIGEIQAKLLQKIEELTLYLVQQHKEIEQLKREKARKSIVRR